MRAFVVNQYKGPLQQADVPEPVVGEHDVLVQVQAAGLNMLDEKIRAGEFKQIQLAKHLGATVATTVSTGNVDFVRELGANPVLRLVMTALCRT